MKGTIRERTNKDGSVSWLCQVEISQDPATNKRRFRSGVASTRREANSLVHKLIRETEEAKEQASDGTAQTLGTLIERWLELGGPATPSTRLVYAGYIKNQIKPYLWDMRLDRLKVADMNRWYAVLRAKRLRPASIRKAHKIVRAVLVEPIEHAIDNWMFWQDNFNATPNMLILGPDHAGNILESR
jgi:Phage integrase, N-terminal SAM-like domain